MKMEVAFLRDCWGIINGTHLYAVFRRREMGQEIRTKGGVDCGACLFILSLSYS